ncbi:MAG TPA: FliH/SctL family protein [Thermoleophilaceae bacterium]
MSSVAAEAPESAFSFTQLPPEPVGARPAAGLDPRAMAEDFMAAARAEADDLRHAARQQGYEEGYQAGMAAAREELAPASAALGEALAAAQQLRGELADTMEERAVELAMRVAEKVVSGAIEVQPERVTDVVRGALRCLVDRERVTVQVNTLDLELVREVIEPLASTLGGIEHFDVQEDRRVSRGGALVRSAAGEVDATIESKLERAREVLEAELQR